VAHESCGGTLVVPGDSATSYLVRKLVDSAPCEGSQMPTGEAILPQPLQPAELDAVMAWIAAGAPD
jgi:hypothetical protein